MRKGFLVMLAVVLVAALAAPAMAGTDINGFYRAKANLSNFRGYLGGAYIGSVVPAKDAPAAAYVEQRMRVRLATGEENVKAVFFLETDDVWGDSAGGSRNTGGGLGADAASIELKNAFVWFKLPNTSVDVTVGLQNQSDSYAGVFFNAADMGGIFVNAKLAPVDLRLGWSKWNENVLAKADDRTLYLAEAKFSPTKNVKSAQTSTWCRTTRTVRPLPVPSSGSTCLVWTRPSAQARPRSTRLPSISSGSSRTSRIRRRLTSTSAASRPCPARSPERRPRQGVRRSALHQRRR